MKGDHDVICNTRFPFARTWRTYHCWTGLVILSGKPLYTVRTRIPTTGSVVQHSGEPTAAESRSEAQALGAHREVRHQVPDESDELDDRRDQSEQGALKLKTRRKEGSAWVGGEVN
jgi:hypothetical protein